MKIKSVAAVGALGIGLGVASFIGGTGTASADQCGQSPIGFTPSNIVCNINAQTGTFAMSVSPQHLIGTFLNGTEAVPGDPSTNDGLGILQQPQTFVSSVQDFLSGPKSP